MIEKSSLELLEFPRLLLLISDLANSDASKAGVLEIHPLTGKDDIDTRQGLIAEIRRLVQQGTPLQMSFFPDISDYIYKLRPEGAVLEAQELSEFIPVLSIASAVSFQMSGEDALPLLKKLTEHLAGFPDILKALRKSLDSEGNILDTASFLLSDLRTQIRRLEAKIRKKLDEIVRDEHVSVFLQDNFVTQRSGRWVIPVRMDSKGQIPGVVHDVSKSGETAFIEPLAIINPANELENLIAEQKAEEIRILRTICAAMRTVLDGIEAEFRTIVYLDVLNCIAKFSDRLNMNMPSIHNSLDVVLVKARHPLLQLSFEKKSAGLSVVPLDISLGGTNTVMVITGANAGGKTIAIKTIGLLMLMALSGMPVPADSSSRLPLVENLLVDMGDEQSIEDNLSTFSAHVSNIAEILEKAGSETVVLMDELGTGTDPEEGAALACAVLREIRKSGSLVFATTHLSDIKGFVHKTEGMLNASMEFDSKTLNPLYRLRMGEPGQSHALAIAKRYGLPEHVIDYARSMIGNIKAELDIMIVDLHEKRSQYEKSLEEIRKQLSEVREKSRALDLMRSESEMKQRNILAKAYQEAVEIIAGAKRQMHSYLDELKKKDQSEIRRLLKQVETMAKQTDQKLRELEGDDSSIPSPEYLKKGDIIFVKSLGSDASIIEFHKKNNRLRVSAGNMEIEVPLSDVRITQKPFRVPEQTSVTFHEPAGTVPLSINLVGLRVDEALSRLERYLNDVSLAELREVMVIHGIGKGLVMKAVRGHLDQHPLVNHYRSGTIDEGGVGVTIVSMK